MEYDATMAYKNTFVTLRLTNHDNDKDEVEEVAEYLAQKLGITYLYVEEKPE